MGHIFIQKFTLDIVAKFVIVQNREIFLKHSNLLENHYKELRSIIDFDKLNKISTLYLMMKIENTFPFKL